MSENGAVPSYSSSMANTFTNIEVGTRVECQSYYGTVKYMGEIKGYNSLWIGIDWDDPTRGKHDGVVNGIKYFQAR